MYTLEDVRKEYARLDRKIGIDTSAIELKISKRAVNRLGSFTSPARPGAAPLRITLSALVMEDEALFYDTIRHEYAHAAAYILEPNRRHGHDAFWKELCCRVGCRPQSRSASETVAQKRREKARYTLRCRGCGSESNFVRRGKTVDMVLRGQGKRLRCTRCGGNDFELRVNK